jgi:transcriptional regulator with XRE-family HTH domain
MNTMTLTIIRKNKGYTSDKIAHKLGISRGHYSHLELGTRNFSNELLEKTASVLGIGVDLITEASEEAKKINYVPDSWVLKIHIDGKPLLQAFKQYLKQTNRKHLEAVDLESEISKFIAYRIEYSVRSEFDKSADLKSYFQAKLA